MNKRVLAVFVLAALLTGGVFAQEMAKNSLTVDFGPTIAGLAFGAIGGMLSDDDAASSSSGLGIGVQYERNLTDRLSIAARGAYLGFGFAWAELGAGSRTDFDMDISSFSVEGHLRFYPFRGGLFVDGMAGYGRIMNDIDGQIVTYRQGGRNEEPISASLARDYVKLGGKAGLRTSLGGYRGGFTFESSVGYYGNIGLGDSLGDQLEDSLDGRPDRMNDINDLFTILENMVLIGGPRITLAVGWRF